MRVLLIVAALFFSGLSLRAQETGTFTDPRDGKTYKTVKIDSQIWMAENLNYDIKYSWCIDCETYGRLYNWDAALMSCPVGWHLPSDEEWVVLTSNVGGGSLKEAGTAHWKSPNTGATNKSGFTALPHGYRALLGSLDWDTKIGFWWSSTPHKRTYAWTWRLDYNLSTVTRQISNKPVGMSVRCIKD